MSEPKNPYDNTLAGTSELTQKALDIAFTIQREYVDTKTRAVPDGMWERLGFTPEEIEAGNKP